MKEWRLVAITYFVLINSWGSAQNLDSLLCWSSQTKLKWEDFRGSIPVGKNQLASFKAICSSNIILRPYRETDTSRYTYKVKAVFRRYESWTKDSTKRLLAHEQLHFDIAEVYVREIRKAIKELGKAYALTDEYIQSYIRKLLSERKLRNEDYDRATAHGLIKKEQLKWAQKITTELETLSAYASTSNDCN